MFHLEHNYLKMSLLCVCDIAYDDIYLPRPLRTKVHPGASVFGVPRLHTDRRNLTIGGEGGTSILQSEKCYQLD